MNKIFSSIGSAGWIIISVLSIVFASFLAGILVWYFPHFLFPDSPFSGHPIWVGFRIFIPSIIIGCVSAFVVFFATKEMLSISLQVFFWLSSGYRVFMRYASLHRIKPKTSKS